MQVRVKETGELVHVPAKNQIIDLLIKAGTIEPVQEAPAAHPPRQEWVPPKTPARWFVQEEYRTGNFVIGWSCPDCKQGGRFAGVKIDKVHLLRAWHCGHEGGERVPAEIAAQYMTINKPAAALFYEPPQPARQYARINTEFHDGVEVGGAIHPATAARLEAERNPARISTGPSFEEAMRQYTDAVKEAEDFEAAERAKANAPAQGVGKLG